jgi:hypothetical protein
MAKANARKSAFTNAYIQEEMHSFFEHITRSNSYYDLVVMLIAQYFGKQDTLHHDQMV